MNTTGTATDYYDLLDKLNTFLTATGSAFGMSYAGTGNGTIGAYTGGSASVAETFAITATSSTSFSVVGSVSGSVGTATVGTPFTSTKINFTITAGGTAFVSGDAFSLATAPKWSVLRRGGCADERFRLGNLTNLANAFDGVGTTFATLALASNPTVGVQLAVAAQILEFGWGINTTLANGPTTLVLEYSDNNSTWTTAQTASGISWSSNFQYQRFAVSGSPGSHVYWRVRATAGVTTIDCSEIGFYPSVGYGENYAQRFSICWQAFGNNGTQAVYINAATVANVASDYYNLQFVGALGYTDSATTLNQIQPSGVKALLGTNASMKYWFIANGQRVIIVAKSSTTYHAAYLGLFYPYGTPAQYTLPFVIAASTSTVTYRWSTQNADCRFIADPNTGFDLLDAGNTWRTFSNRNSTGVGDGVSDLNGRYIHPTKKGDGTMFDYVRDNLGGGYTLIPLIPMMQAPSLAAMGELEGVYWVSGYSNASENTLSDSGFTHLVVQNIWRTQIQHYMAVRLD